MVLTCIIVEDEPLARERLTDYVRQLPRLELLATFDNAIAALAFLQSTRVDLVFLDVALGGLSGIELLETTAVTSQVILTTAHHEHAVKAYDLKVIDYLLKPFTFQRFVQAVDRVQGSPTTRDKGAEKKVIFVKTEFRLEKVRLSDILYIEGHRDYRRIQTLQKKILTPQTFVEFEEQIAPADICRVHKSFMVALDKIETIERDRIKIRDVLIPISATYRERFYALIDHRTV